MARASKQVGALWRKTPKQGNPQAYLSGVIDLGIHGEIAIAVFKNDKKKEGSQQPDYRIVLSQQRSGGNKPDGSKTPSPSEPGEDDLPF